MCKLKYGVLFFSLLAMTGCSMDRTQNYYVKNAASLPPLIIPEGVQDPTLNSYYPVPPIQISVVRPVLTPPGEHLQAAPLPAPAATKKT